MSCAPRKPYAEIEFLEPRLLLSISELGQFAALGNLPQEYVTDEVLVRVKPGHRPASILQNAGLSTSQVSRVLDQGAVNVRFLSTLGLGQAKMVGRLAESSIFELAYSRMSDAERGLCDIYQVKLAPGQDVQAAIKQLGKQSSVVFAEPNYILTAQMVPDDPFWSSSDSWSQGYDDLWGLKQLDCQNAWDITQGSGVVVAVIDTGVDYTHEDLAANMWVNPGETAGDGVDNDSNGIIDDYYGADFVDDDGNPMDVFGHGTHCAGTIAAVGNNDLGVIGVAPQAQIMAVRFLDASGNGSTVDAISAVYYAVDEGADVLSNSWGGPTSSSLETAFGYAHSNGVVVVASAGNDNTDVSGQTPASYQNVITVGASTPTGKKAGFSNYGFGIDIMAPGGGDGYSLTSNILSTMSSGMVLATRAPQLEVADGYYRLAGTSMACPHVAGIAALVLSEFPGLTPEAVQARIMGGAEYARTQPTPDAAGVNELNPAYAHRLGSGLADAYGALTVSSAPFMKVVEYTASLVPGEAGSIQLAVENQWSSATNVTVTLTTSDPLITITDGTTTLGSIASGATVSNAADPFTFVADEDLSLKDHVECTLTLSGDGGYSQVIPFSMQTEWFQDRTADTGGYIQLDPFLPVSVSMHDIDGDDIPELAIASTIGTPSFQVYGADVDGVWTPLNSGIGLTNGSNSWGTIFADFDKDGDDDLFIPGNFAGRMFFGNDGDGTFTNLTSTCGFEAGQSIITATLIDYDNDGDLDIFNGYSNTSDAAMYRNNGNLTFTAQSAATIGLSGTWDSVSTSVAFDYDRDGDQDLLVSLKNSGSGTVLLRNNGNATFTDVTTASGIAASSYGAAVGDYDNDGDQDILGYQKTTSTLRLYRNDGSGAFDDVAASAGLNPGFAQTSYGGTAFWDFDNDADLDIYYSSGAGLDGLWANNGDGTFEDVTFEALPYGVISGGGAAGFGDYDNNGTLDLVCLSSSMMPGTGCILENKVGLENNWLKLKLAGVTSNTNAYGAKVYVTTGSTTQMREITHDAVQRDILHFGLGQNADADLVRIVWPSGKVQELTNVSANQIINVTEADNTTPAVTDVDRNVSGGYPDEMNTLRFAFSDSVRNSLDVDDLLLENLTYGTTVDLSSLDEGDLAYDVVNNTATWDLASLNLAPGYYKATLLAAGINDGFGHSLDGDGNGTGGDNWVSAAYPNSGLLVTVGGDANLDGLVDTGDLGILSYNYNQSGKTWAQADFNHDGWTNSADLAILNAVDETTLHGSVTLSGDDAIRDGLTYTLSMTTHDAAGGSMSVVSWIVDWGDGTVDTISYTGTSKQATHAYTTAAQRTISVRAQLPGIAELKTIASTKLVEVCSDANGTLSDATSVSSLPTEISGNLGNDDSNAVTGVDVDLYSLSAAAGQYYSFHSDRSCEMRVFNSSGTELTSATGQSLQFRPTTAGTYYLGISGTGNDSYDPTDGSDVVVGTNLGSYTLQISCLNNRLADAISLGAVTLTGVNVSATLGTDVDYYGNSINVGLNDLDMYSFTATAGQIISYSALPTLLSIYDSSGNRLGYTTSSEEWEIPATGTYYFGITAGYDHDYSVFTGLDVDFAQSQTSYSLWLSLYEEEE